jgi:tRNA modification GTPase
MNDLDELKELNAPYIVVGNKIDKDKKNRDEFRNFDGIVYISAANKIGVEELKEEILAQINLKTFKTGNTVVTNIRHYESLLLTKDALNRVLSGISSGITGDLLAQDIRASLHHLGEITGEITTDDLLENIFRKFCIGK